jgi:ABC-type multidrug transport system fused ATPase/permease subunit
MPTARSPHVRLLLTYLRPQRRRIAGLAVLLLADLGLQLGLPRVAQGFIDSALAGAALQTLVAIGGAYLAVAIVQNLIWVGWHYVAQDIGLIATNRIRADLTLHCLKLDMSFHNARTPGEMIERIDGDVTQLTNFLSSFLVQLTINGLLLVGVLGALVFVDWRVAVPMIVGVTIAAIGARLLTPRLAPLSAKERQASAELYGFLEERLSGTEDIRANGGTAYVLRRHIERTRNLFYAMLKATVLGVISWRATKTAVDAGAALAIGIGALLFVDGALSLGAVYLVVVYTDMIREPVEQILREFEDLQQATASMGRVQVLFDTQPKLAALAPASATPLPTGPLAVSFQDVTFAYPDASSDDEAVLTALSIRLPAGSTLGVLGRTGSGKTTLTRLLLRLYDPVAGQVCIGGVDARQASNNDLRARVAVVTQDIQLFSATVRDNLTLFDPAVPDEKIWAALEAVGLADWARNLPRGLDSTLASGGSGLSAGESQLLAFARAFLRDPGVVILDEASSRLDPATEHKLERAVSRLLEGRTGILIAHRLRTLQRVQHILILENGRVLETGLRETLVNDPQSRFAQLLSAGDAAIEQALV